MRWCRAMRARQSGEAEQPQTDRKAYEREWARQRRATKKGASIAPHERLNGVEGAVVIEKGSRDAVFSEVEAPNAPFQRAEEAPCVCIDRHSKSDGTERTSGTLCASEH